MVYFLIPFCVATVSAASGIAVGRTFFATENAVARAAHGLPSDAPTPYPLPGVLLPFLDGAPTDGPSATTNAGMLAAGASMLVAYRVQKRFVFKQLAQTKLAGAPAPGEQINNINEFIAESAMPSAAIYLNLMSSAIVAGVVKPLVDGSPAPSDKKQ